MQFVSKTWKWIKVRWWRLTGQEYVELKITAQESCVTKAGFGDLVLRFKEDEARTRMEKLEK